MELENKMLIDEYWPDYEDDEEEQESEWEKFCRRADEEYDLHCGDESFFAWSRREDGYHF